MPARNLPGGAVRYIPAAVNGTDSLSITSFDAIIELAIPVAKALVIRTTRSLTDLRTIPDILTVEPIDSLNQVVNAIVLFRAAPADYTLAAVEALSAGRRVTAPADPNSRWIETAFRIAALNDLTAISNIAEVDLDFPGSEQAGEHLPRPAGGGIRLLRHAVVIP